MSQTGHLTLVETFDTLRDSVPQKYHGDNSSLSPHRGVLKIINVCEAFISYRYSTTEKPIKKIIISDFITGFEIVCST